MTAPYRLADGKVVDVETSREVAELLAAYERQDASERRRKRRHNEISIEAIIEQCAWEPIASTDIEAEYIEQEESRELIKAIEEMDEENQELIRKVFYESISARTIAQEKRISFQAIYKKLNKALAGLREAIAC